MYTLYLATSMHLINAECIMHMCSLVFVIMFQYPSIYVATYIANYICINLHVTLLLRSLLLTPCMVLFCVWFRQLVTTMHKFYKLW